MPSCCGCNGSGRCIACVCKRLGRCCTNCAPARAGRCVNLSFKAQAKGSGKGSGGGSSNVSGNGSSSSSGSANRKSASSTPLLVKRPVLPSISRPSHASGASQSAPRSCLRQLTSEEDEVNGAQLPSSVHVASENRSAAKIALQPLRTPQLGELLLLSQPREVTLTLNIVSFLFRPQQHQHLVCKEETKMIGDKEESRNRWRKAL